MGVEAWAAGADGFGAATTTGATVLTGAAGVIEAFTGAAGAALAWATGALA